jgi:hypothetical protein
MASSTSAHVPESYPDDIPSSPGLAVSSDLDTSDDDYVKRDNSIGESENAGMEIEPEDEGSQADSGNVVLENQDDAPVGKSASRWNTGLSLQQANASTPATCSLSVKSINTILSGAKAQIVSLRQDEK